MKRASPFPRGCSYVELEPIQLVLWWREEVKADHVFSIFDSWKLLVLNPVGTELLLFLLLLCCITFRRINTEVLDTKFVTRGAQTESWACVDMMRAISRFFLAP